MGAVLGGPLFGALMRAGGRTGWAWDAPKGSLGPYETKVEHGRLHQHWGICCYAQMLHGAGIFSYILGHVWGK